MPVPLDFDIVEREPGLPVGHALTITGVVREARGIRITYQIQPPVPSRADRPHVEAQDDCGQGYRGLGQSVGLGRSRDRTITLGSFVVPRPQPHASLLRVRMSWSAGAISLWERPAHELRITL
jgi:hypothetical protein